MIRLLLVDDEPVTRKGLLEFIPWSTLGVGTVESAADGAEALETAARLRPDIVVSDIKMPRMTGVEFARRLKQLLPGCRVIFLSAYADKSNLKHAIDLRVDKFLEKPIKRDELTRAVGSLAKEIEAERAEETERRRKAMEGLRLARQRLAHELISPAGARQLAELVALAELDMLYYPYVTSMFAKFGRMGDPDLLRRHEDALYDRMENRFSETGLCLFAFAGPRELAIHLFTPQKPSWNEGAQALRAVKLATEEAAGISLPVFLGIGPTVEELPSVSQSYADAAEAAEALFYLGYDGVSIHSPSARHASSLEDMSQAFADRLKEFDQDGAQAILVDFAKGARASRAEPVLVRRRYDALIRRLEQVSHDFGLPPERTEALRKAAAESDTLEEIRVAFSMAVAEDFGRIDANKRLGSVVSLVNRLIESQYSDSALSIRTLCRQVYLSETYLCDVYKKRTGETVNSRITAVRMEKAKGLLKNDRVKVAAISGMVGYSSSDYFTKLFKKHTGMTPSEFRDSCCAPEKGAT